MSTTERRSIPFDLSNIEIEQKSSGISGLRGYAAVYHRGPGDEFRIGKVVERIMPGAFARSLKEGSDVVCLFNHDDNFLLGRRSAKTLRLYDDEKGLRYSVDTPNTSYGRDLVEMVSRGDVKGSSFSFRVNGPQGEDWRTEGDMIIREIRDVDLIDVSAVTAPAYQSSSVGLRSIKDWAEARKLTGAELKALMDQAMVCGLSVDYMIPPEEKKQDPDAGAKPVVGAYSLSMARRRLRLLELESAIRS